MKAVKKIKCSRSCGRGCTQDEYDSAVQAANKLLGKLKGRGWRIRVWENAGWHYSVIGNGMSVMPSIEANTYWAMLGDRVGCGDCLWTEMYGRSFRNPNAAVRHTLNLAAKAVSAKIAVVVRAEAAFRGVASKSVDPSRLFAATTETPNGS